MENNSIKLTTIQKHTTVLQKIQLMIVQNNGNISERVIKDLCSEHKVTTGELYYAVKCGIFTRISKGKYKCVYDKIDPLHARRVIVFTREYNFKNASKKLKADKETKAIISNKVEPTKKQKQVIVKKYFFGLFKTTTTIYN